MRDVYSRVTQLARAQVYPFMKNHRISPLSYHFRDYFDACLEEFNIKIMPHHFTNRKIEGLTTVDKAGITFSYEKENPVVKQNFTLCHELGHYILEHSGQVFTEMAENSDSPVESEVNPRKKVVIGLWVLLGLSFSFAIFKHFTAVDTHTIHETTIIEKEYVDTHNVENFVENFAKVYYSWELNDQSIDNRMENLKAYLTEELQALNIDTVRKDIPVSSSVRGVQIWMVKADGENQFDVTYSVDQLITEGENIKTVHSAYEVTVYVDGSGNMVLTKNPTITSIPKKSDYKPKVIESDGTVDSIMTNEIIEFLTTFFKLYPTATASELSYYVNDGILKSIGKDYIFQELVNPIYNRKDNQVTVSLTVKYLDQQTKATQVSQFDLVLEKVGNNWKIIK